MPTVIGATCAAVLPMPKADATPPFVSLSPVPATKVAIPLCADPQNTPDPPAAAMPVSTKGDTHDLVPDSLDDSLEQTIDFSMKMRKGYEVREYQKELAEPGMNGENYIIIAPTGSGKTVVAALVISDHLQKNQGRGSCHVVFVVNTRPLADQQKMNLEDLIPEAQVEQYTGAYSSTVADSINVKNNISVCTAGKFREDIRKGSVKFDELSLLIFDECHHASKKGHMPMLDSWSITWSKRRKACRMASLRSLE